MPILKNFNELFVIKQRSSLCVKIYWIFFAPFNVALASKFQCRTDANNNCARYCDLSLCHFAAAVRHKILFIHLFMRLHFTCYKCVSFFVSFVKFIICHGNESDDCTFFVCTSDTNRQIISFSLLVDFINAWCNE